MKIIVQNLACEYEDAGAGKVMLFLHGWQDSLHTFDALSSRFSKTNRVVRLDLPGFGKAELPKEAWDLEKYVLFVNEFIQKLNLDVDVLVGHSFGGRISIKAISSDAIKTNKLVLIGSAGIVPEKTFRNRVVKILGKITPKTLKQNFRSRFYSQDYQNAGPLKETFLKIISEDLQEQACKISVSTLLIYGINDTETPVSYGERFHALIKNSRLEVLPYAGHFVHKEKSEAVTKLIQDFIC